FYKSDTMAPSTCSFLLTLSILLVTIAETVAKTNDTEFRITASVTPVPVNVGQSANLTCHLESAGKQRKTYSVYWHSPTGAEVAENCIAYNIEKHDIFCNNRDAKLATKYTVRIKTVSWKDRGLWYCKFVTNQSYAFLDVNWPATIERFTATPVGQPSRDAAAGQQAAAAAAAKAADGSAAAPYDLTLGGGLKFTCRSTCGYPAAQLKLDYRGVSVQLPDPANPNAFRVRSVSDNSTCSSDGNLLKTTESTVLLPNCSALKLDGKTRFRCAIGDSAEPAIYKDIYVYCPAIPRDYPLTQGEIAAASVGAVLGVFLIILGFVLFCQRKPAEELDESASQPMQV
ncbi:hypothetical protein BOX15_Mlig029336g1, partial [Macrostomum lignano]